MKIQINSDIAPKVTVVGDEGIKIIVIDNFLNDLQSVREFARTGSKFQLDGKTAYPGVRAELPLEYLEAVISVLKPLIFKEYDVPLKLDAQVAMGYYSLLTTPASDLQVIQRIPHFDNSKKFYFAILHYLNEGAFGGTGFFRHRPTRFEYISQERKEIYLQSVNTFMSSRGLPEPQYINRSTNHFELLAEVAYRPNRLVIYPGALLHSGLVGNSDISGDPALGRLTANIFMDCI